MVGAEGSVLFAGPAKLGERDDDQIVPGAFVVIDQEILSEGVHGPGNAPLQIGMSACELTLIVVRVENIAPYLGARNNGVGFVQNECGGFEIGEKRISPCIHDIFSRVAAM